MTTNIRGGFVVRANGKPTILSLDGATLKVSTHPGVATVFDRKRSAERAINRTKEGGTKANFGICRVASLLTR